MSEMLGNYHFLIRNYSSAIREFEKIVNNSAAKKTQKKLIICYTQTGQLDKALDLFYKLIREDIRLITNTNPEKEDCPCPELTKKLEEEFLEKKDSYETNVELGILWLYCDKGKSLEYFQNAEKINSSDERISSIIQILKQTNKNHN
ncbi:tol-pal system YbgF family protein [Melioribacteraceae bacterium 4301-Me]|uniref:tetratricopeptide repeat protein n=1 Tax=Pyranulibacter aquaticus TaxID=3163344 RepID=UPI0035992F1A